MLQAVDDEFGDHITQESYCVEFDKEAEAHDLFSPDLLGRKCAHLGRLKCASVVTLTCHVR